MTQEHAIFGPSLQKCLDLRAKYINVSLQRLGDDPRDYDAHSPPLNTEYTDCMGVKSDYDGPDKDVLSKPDSGANADGGDRKKWNIYPRPPPPHWHWGKGKENKETAVSADGSAVPANEPHGVFEFGECEVPGGHDWVFELDDRGVYQVYRGEFAETSSGEIIYQLV